MCSNEELKKMISASDKFNEIERDGLRESIDDLKKLFISLVDGLRAEINVANMISGFNKWLFRLAITLIAAFSGASSYYLQQDYKTRSDTAISTAKLLQTVQDIEKRYAEQQIMLLHVDDTLETAISIANYFYTNAWHQHLIHDKRLTDTVIHNSIILKEHENRIMQLEHIIK